MILRLGQEVTEILLLILQPLTLQDLTITITAAAEEEEEVATRVTTTIRPVVTVMADATLDVIQDVEVDMVTTVAVTIGPRTEAPAPAEIVMDHRPIRPTKAADTTTTTVSLMCFIHCCVMTKIKRKNSPLNWANANCFIHSFGNIDSDEPQVQKSADTVYISGLGTDKSERELVDKLSERFASIGRIKIDKRTNLPKSKLLSSGLSHQPCIEVECPNGSRTNSPTCLFCLCELNSSYLYGFLNGSAKGRW
jgi:hypothetical protein